MSKRNCIRVVNKEEDDSNILYFISLSRFERLTHLEQLRTQYISLIKYKDSQQGFQRVYRVIKREQC